MYCNHCNQEGIFSGVHLVETNYGCFVPRLGSYFFLDESNSGQGAHA